jgi:hypothetical protein
MTVPFNPVLKQFCAERGAEMKKMPVTAINSLSKASLIAAW